MSAWDPSSSSSSETNSENPSWIHWYCNLRGHNFFLAVPDDFIEDDFNLTGLSGVVKYYTAALEMILDLEPSEPTSVPMPDENMIRADAELLYSLIHQRYINTKQGLFHMAHRYQAGEFGRCPRLGCGNCAVLPVGRFDQTGMDTMKLYCPRCIDIYHPPDPVYVQIDGAFFGSSFPHMLFKTFPELLPSINVNLREIEQWQPLPPPSPPQPPVVQTAPGAGRPSGGSPAPVSASITDPGRAGRAASQDSDMASIRSGLHDVEMAGTDGAPSGGGGGGGGAGPGAASTASTALAAPTRAPAGLPDVPSHFVDAVKRYFPKPPTHAQVPFDAADYWVYQPKIFGFRVHASAPDSPKMQWRRWRSGTRFLEHPSGVIRRMRMRGATGGAGAGGSSATAAHPDAGQGDTSRANSDERGSRNPSSRT